MAIEKTTGTGLTINEVEILVNITKLTIIFEIIEQPANIIAKV